jgi:hypothetical protein
VRWLGLYLRSRRVPVAVTAAAVVAVLMWTLWSVNSDTRDVAPQTVVLTVLLMVVALTATFSGPDDALESTAAIAWLPRRLAHVLAGFALIALLLLVTLTTGARFGPAWMVLRDTAGLLGLTALGAAVFGTARSWFLPLGWTLAAVLFPQFEPLAARVLTWQMQEPASTAAAVTAILLAVGGLGAYLVRGPLPMAPAEAAQQH